MSDASTPTSLERYIRTRGHMLVSGSASARSLNIQNWVGGGLLGFAALMAVVAFAVHVPEVAFGAAGPAIAGGVNMIVSKVLRRRLTQAAIQPVTVTPEARGMLLALTWQYMWSKNPWIWSMGYAQPEGTAAAQYQWCMPATYPNGMRKTVTQRDLDSLPQAVRDIIEEAAAQFNRIAGALEAGASSPNLERLRDKVLLGSDEAILDVFHQAALISKYPESVGTIQAQLDARVSTLRELGDRVEALAQRDPTFTEMLMRRTTADEVLEELRLEQTAFSELASLDDERLRQNLQG